MHYKDGTEAKVGDVIFHQPPEGSGYSNIAVVVQLFPETTTCNVYAASIATIARSGGAPLVTVVTGGGFLYFNASDCVKVA